MLFERIVKQALEQENVGLLTNAGYAFENGIGYAQDYAMAHRFYIVAAQYGDDQAINNLGWLTLNGFGVKKDVEKAAELFRKAADMGNSTAMVNLGNLYEDGIPDGETDYTQAIIWYKKAADKGDETGMSTMRIVCITVGVRVRIARRHLPYLRDWSIGSIRTKRIQMCVFIWGCTIKKAVQSHVITPRRWNGMRSAPNRNMRSVLISLALCTQKVRACQKIRKKQCGIISRLRLLGTRLPVQMSAGCTKASKNSGIWIKLSNGSTAKVRRKMKNTASKRYIGWVMIQQKKAFSIEKGCVNCHAIFS